MLSKAVEGSDGVKYLQVVLYRAESHLERMRRYAARRSGARGKEARAEEIRAEEAYALAKET